MRKGVLHSTSWSVPLFNALFGAGFRAPAAVQAVIPVDYDRFSRNVDALLRADGIAQLAADAAASHVISRRLPLALPDENAVARNMGRVTDVEELAIRLVQLKYLERTARVAGIDGLHIGILFENLVQLFTANVFDFTSQGNRYVVLGGRQSDIALLHELGIKRFALSGEEIHALLVIEHHIDHAGLRMPVRSDRSHRSGMDILYQQL